MAIVYGYFRTEDEARQAARRCEELGITSAVLTDAPSPAYVDELDEARRYRRDEKDVVKWGLIICGVLGLVGMLLWFAIPGLWGKLFLAGPLMTALYGAAVGIFVGMIVVDRRRRREAKDGTHDELAARRDSIERVVVCNVTDIGATHNVERLLENEGAVEIIHRAA